jgi:uncharacterized protein
LAGYFFDSSALVKLYHAEAGTATVSQIVNTTGNLIRVSRLTVAELTSAFAIKARTQSINREDADLFLRQFREDVTSGMLEVFSIGESEFALAELLLERYALGSRLRSLDALQLPTKSETGRSSETLSSRFARAVLRSCLRIGQPTLSGWQVRYRTLSTC